MTVDESEHDQRLDGIAFALADPTRRRLLRLVRDRRHSAGELAAQFSEISRPAVSQHLKVLRQAGLVDVSTLGRNRIYAARAEALAPISRFVDEMWTEALPRLKRAAEQSARTRATPK